MFTFNRPLNSHEIQFLTRWVATAHRPRCPHKLMAKYNGEFGRPACLGKKYTSPEEIYGTEGQFFAPEEGFDEFTDDTIISTVYPAGWGDFDKKDGGVKVESLLRNPNNCPQIWCVIEVTTDGFSFIDWDDHYNQKILWMKFLIHNFFYQWIVVVNGVASVGQSNLYVTRNTVALGQ